MQYNFFFWWSVVSTIIGVILLCLSIWQTARAQSEKNRKKDQIKIWMQHADGVSQGLKRIARDNLDKRYSSTQDIANAVWALEANAFALRQSLYEERCVTEPEYKLQQKEIMEQLKKNMSAASQNNMTALPVTLSKEVKPLHPTESKTNQS